MSTPVSQMSSSSQVGPVHGAMTTPKMSMDEFDGLLEIMQEDARRRLLQYFYGARLVYDPGFAGKLLAKVAKGMEGKASSVEGHAAIEGAKAIGMIQSVVTEIIKAVQEAVSGKAAEAGFASMITNSIQSRATELATSAFGPSFIAQATPFLGLIPSAYSAVTKSYAAVDGIVKAVHANRYSQVVKVGSPRAAAEATAAILKRKSIYLSTTAATSVTNLGAGIANAASGGIASAADVSIKVATAVADLIAELTMFAIELYEHAAGEQMLLDLGKSPHILQVPQSRVDILLPAAFNACPLLGCYMLASAPYFNTSDFVTLTAGPATVASVDEIQRIAVQNVNPLRLYASQIINDSKLKLKHTHRSDLNKIMDEASIRAQSAEAKSLTGRFKKKFIEPVKKKLMKMVA